MLGLSNMDSDAYPGQVDYDWDGGSIHDMVKEVFYN